MCGDARFGPTTVPLLAALLDAQERDPDNKSLAENNKTRLGSPSIATL
jgi:hypothetical protein